MQTILIKHLCQVTSLRPKFPLCTAGPGGERHGRSLFYAIKVNCFYFRAKQLPTPHLRFSSTSSSRSSTHLEEAERRRPHEDQIIAGSGADTLSCQRGTADFRWEGLQRGGGGGAYFHVPSLTGDGERSLWCNSRVHHATLIPFAGIVTGEGGQRPFR